MNERQTARELPRVIATCTVPKKMRPEDLPIKISGTEVGDRAKARLPISV